MKTPLKPAAPRKRPRCQCCTETLEPQVIGEIFTGHYGRLGDDHFCGASCGYQWALALLECFK